MEALEAEKKTDLQFFIHTEDVWNAMYEDCAQARLSIEFEQYILRDDEAGNRFLRLFADKAREGVAIRLMLDKIGSRALAASDNLKKIREQGGEVHFYNSIGLKNLFRPSTWFPRNHTKTMLIDSSIGYIGSACLAEHMRSWRDTQMRFTGSLLKEVEEDFANRWGRTTQKIKDFYCRSTSERGIFRYVVTSPRLMLSPIYRELLDEIDRAENYVWLVTPYFLPPKALRAAMRAAVKRGVDVRVMMTAQTDVPMADYVSQTYLPRLLAMGIRMFLYKKTVLHAKYAIIDGRWATLGSTNMDYLSLLRNREANIIIRDPATIAELEGHFISDLKECVEADGNYFHRLPLKNKILGYMGRPVRGIL